MSSLCNSINVYRCAFCFQSLLLSPLHLKCDETRMKSVIRVPAVMHSDVNCSICRRSGSDSGRFCSVHHLNIRPDQIRYLDNYQTNNCAVDIEENLLFFPLNFKHFCRLATSMQQLCFPSLGTEFEISLNIRRQKFFHSFSNLIFCEGIR
jgi:hypothetical protein